MVIKDNPIGVLTEFIQNLQFTLSPASDTPILLPYPATANLLEGVTIEPLGNEAATFGLPVGFLLQLSAL